MLEKCILARHKAGVYLRCNYLNKFTKIVLWLVEWTQLTWIVGINLVSKTFCWKKPCIYYATCIICKFVLPIWFPLHSEEVCIILNELWNESMYISDHPDMRYLTRQERLHATTVHLSQYYMRLEKKNAQSEMYLLHFCLHVLFLKLIASFIWVQLIPL